MLLTFIVAASWHTSFVLSFGVLLNYVGRFQFYPNFSISSSFLFFDFSAICFKCSW